MRTSSHFLLDENNTILYFNYGKTFTALNVTNFSTIVYLGTVDMESDIIDFVIKQNKVKKIDESAFVFVISSNYKINLLGVNITDKSYFIAPG